jgi:hypothetical protein
MSLSFQFHNHTRRLILSKKKRETAIQTSEKKLKYLMGRSRSTYKDQRALSGVLGQLIADAVEHDHLHRKAFSAVRAEDRMEPEKLAAYYDALEFYRDVLGLTERAESAPSFPTVIEGGKEKHESTAVAAE